MVKTKIYFNIKIIKYINTSHKGALLCANIVMTIV